jgi:protein-tyrosine phosphatase
VSNSTIDSILFVCLGNICRSPLAEGIAKQQIAKRGLHVKVDSAGTGDWHEGEAPCRHSIKVAKSHDLDISRQRARQITTRDLDHFDLIIALDDNNFRDLKRMGAKHLYKLGDFGFDGEDIPDPYFFPGFEGFENVYAMIYTAVCQLLESDALKKN